MLHLKLPWPPSVNKYYRTWKGRTIISRNGRLYIREVLNLCRGLCETLRGDLAMLLKFHPPDRRRRDLDNLLKATFDALQNARVYEDDYQIVRFFVDKGEPIKNGVLLATLKHADSEEKIICYL